jgi:hypothetical protein
METRCEALNIDLMKFINSYEDKTYVRLQDVRKKVAIKMIGLLSDYQRNEKPIPIDILKGKS